MSQKDRASRFLSPPFSALLFLASLSLYPRPALAQSSTWHSSAISVQELTMSPKAARAFEKGSALLLKGEPQASIPFFQSVIDLFPNSYRPYHNLGLAHARIGKLDEAAAEFQKSIDLSEGAFAPSLFGLSMVFYQRSDFLQAKSLIERGLLVAPASAVGKYYLALVQFSLGHTGEAQRNALESLQLDPAQADVYLLLAHIHERLNDPSTVLQHVQSYLKLCPKGVLQSDALALLQRAQQDRARLSASLH